MKPKVDLLVPTFNNGNTVVDTLESLLNQTYENINITIFDNQSTDNTVEMLQPYLKKGIEIVINENNLGGEGNFNRCIEQASAPYFCICHSDDIYEPQFVEAQVQALEENKQATVSFCHAERIDSKGNSLGDRFLPEELEDQWRNILKFEDVLKLSVKYGNIFTCPTAFFRTSTVKENKIKFEGSKFQSSSDLGLWLTLAQQGPVLFHTAPLIHYRESDASFSFALKKARTHRHDLFLVLDEFTTNNSDVLSEDFPQWQRYKNFLEFKDQMLRVFNVIKTKNWSQWPKKTVSPWSTLSLLLVSPWHLKFGFKALVIYIFSRPMKFFY